MCALLLLSINQYTKLEVSSFTNYKDMIGAKFTKTGHMTLTTPLLGVVFTVG